MTPDAISKAAVHDVAKAMALDSGITENDWKNFWQLRALWSRKAEIALAAALPHLVAERDGEISEVVADNSRLLNGALDIADQNTKLSARIKALEEALAACKVLMEHNVSGGQPYKGPAACMSAIVDLIDATPKNKPVRDGDVWKGIADGKQVVIQQLERTIAERDTEIARLHGIIREMARLSPDNPDAENAALAMLEKPHG